MSAGSEPQATCVPTVGSPRGRIQPPGRGSLGRVQWDAEGSQVLVWDRVACRVPAHSGDIRHWQLQEQSRFWTEVWASCGVAGLRRGWLQGPGGGAAGQ